MKTWELQAKPGFDALTLVERPSQEVGALDVKVRVRAVSLNYRDVMIARGAVNAKQPRVPVSDGAGEVIAVGAKVTKWKVGDRVMGSFFPSWVDGELRSVVAVTACSAKRSCCPSIRGCARPTVGRSKKRRRCRAQG